METTRTGDSTTTTLAPTDHEKLYQLLAVLGPRAKVEPLGRYQKMSPEDIWSALVSQVCVMGSARGMEAIIGDAGRAEEFAEATSLAVWHEHHLKPAYMAAVLRKHKATRFHAEAARKLGLVVAAPEAVRGAQVVLLDGLPGGAEPNLVREELMHRCPVFKRKSASDFMITTGLSHDVVALDTRVVGALRDYLGYNLRAAQVQGSREVYLSVETALREVCRGAGVALAVLDRVIFQFAGMSALAYVMDVG